MLWILKPKDNLQENDNPWGPWYDKAFGFVVRANSENEARQFANSDAGDENRGEFLSKEISKTKTPWLDVEYSTCEPLEDHEGSERGVIMKDFWAA